MQKGERKAHTENEGLLVRSPGLEFYHSPWAHGKSLANARLLIHASVAFAEKDEEMIPSDINYKCSKAASITELEVTEILVLSKSEGRADIKKGF